MATIKAFKVNALDYIPKPIEVSELESNHKD